MPRKDKVSEMKGWLKEYKPFLVEVDFIAYKAAICVLAADYPDALEKMAICYPGLTVTIISQLTAVIV